MYYKIVMDFSLTHVLIPMVKVPSIHPASRPSGYLDRKMMGERPL